MLVHDDGCRISKLLIRLRSTFVLSDSLNKINGGYHQRSNWPIVTCSRSTSSLSMNRLQLNCNLHLFLSYSHLENETTKTHITRGLTLNLRASTNKPTNTNVCSVFLPKKSISPLYSSHSNVRLCTRSRIHFRQPVRPVRWRNPTLTSYR